MLGGAGEVVLTSDLAKWNVHGPVHTLRIEFAEWDLSTEGWKEPGCSTLVQFRSDGRIEEMEGHNPDGSISRSSYVYDEAGRLTELRFEGKGDATGKSIYAYDDLDRLVRIVHVDQTGNEREAESYSYGPEGRKTKVYFVPKMAPNVGFSYGIEGTDHSYGADDAATVATVYDAGGQPDEVLFRDAGQRILRRLVFERDASGRLLKEELRLGEEGLMPEIVKELQKSARGPHEAAILANAICPDRVMCSTTYTYDEAGRLKERIGRVGQLGEQRTTFHYDRDGHLIEEMEEHNSREMQMDEEGNLQPVKERSNKQDVRFEYQYDARGNWTERVVWMRLHPNPNFQRSNVERREIGYYGDAE
jgi:hypothetical protein